MSLVVGLYFNNKFFFHRAGSERLLIEALSPTLLKQMETYDGGHSDFLWTLQIRESKGDLYHTSVETLRVLSKIKRGPIENVKKF